MSENEPKNDNAFRIPHPTRKGYLYPDDLDRLPPSLINDLRNWVAADGTAASKLAALFAEYLVRYPAAPQCVTYDDISAITSKLKTIGVWRYVDIVDFVDGLGETLTDEVKEIIEIFAE